MCLNILEPLRLQVQSLDADKYLWKFSSSFFQCKVSKIVLKEVKYFFSVHILSVYFFKKMT